MAVEYMRAIAARYNKLGYTPYRWFAADAAPPWTPVARPLREARLGVLSTCGAYAVGQVAFHYKDDTSLRRIPSAIAAVDLRFSHITENYLVDAKRDPECMLPLRALRSLVHSGELGALATHVYTCMGGVYSQRRVREEVAPAVAAAMRDEAVDAVLLIPM
jgi:D-proline reductase (dithiol) PrdB